MFRCDPEPHSRGGGYRNETFTFESRDDGGVETLGELRDIVHVKARTVTDDDDRALRGAQDVGRFVDGFDRCGDLEPGETTIRTTCLGSVTRGQGLDLVPGR